MWSSRHTYEVRGTDNGASGAKREIRWYISGSCLVVEDQNNENNDFVRWINPLRFISHLKVTHKDGGIARMQFQVISGSAGNIHIASPVESVCAEEFEEYVMSYMQNRE